MTARTAISLAFLVALLAGCAVRVPAAGDRMARIDTNSRPIEEIGWPERVPHDPVGPNALEGLPPFFAPLGPYERGFLYSFDRASPDQPHITGLLFVSELPASDPTQRRAPLKLNITPRGGTRHSITFPPTIAGTFIAIWNPEVQPDRETSSAEPIARGLVVYLGSLGGISGPERALIEKLVEHGWGVLAVTPSGEILSKEVLSYVGARDKPDGLADRLAKTLDSSFAERVYAVEAGLAYIRENMPGLPQRPLVLVGGSIGAVHLPAVAASLDEPPDAAVLIGGGADFLRLMMSSPLGRDRLKLNWIDGRGTSEDGEPVFYVTSGERTDLEQFFDPVLQRSHLDPYHTAAALAHVPVLQLHARWDAIVPARFGNVLYERLGRPERWIYATGHVGLFLNLHFEAGRIARWIDGAVQRRTAEIVEKSEGD